MKAAPTPSRSPGNRVRVGVERPSPFTCVLGGVLLSHTLASAVPSALGVLASGFGMGPGVNPPAMTTETTNQATHGRRKNHYPTCRTTPPGALEP